MRAAVILALVFLAGAVQSVGYASAGASGNLSVASSGNVLWASRNNTLTLEIANVGKYLKEFDVTLTIPPPLVLFGDNHWIRSSFANGETIRAVLTVFAPSSAASTTLQGTVTAVYKVLGETTPTTESHAISFLIRGWIDIKVYEITLSPDYALPGTEITISGNLLNRGVIAAMYANVTVDGEAPLVRESVKPTYVGQVDPNAPAPFSVTAIIDPDAAEGTYSISIVVYYRDDLQTDQTLTVPVSFSVVSELPQTQTTSQGIVEQILSSEMLILGLVIVVVVLVIVGVVVRRRRKRQET
jgi:hypothetical protein